LKLNHPTHTLTIFLDKKIGKNIFKILKHLNQ
jgi:hypothetical protein